MCVYKLFLYWNVCGTKGVKKNNDALWAPGFVKLCFALVTFYFIFPTERIGSCAVKFRYFAGKVKKECQRYKNSRMGENRWGEKGRADA